MIVAVAAGQQARIAIDPRAPIETMTSYIVNVAKGDVPPALRERAVLLDPIPVGRNRSAMPSVRELI